MTRSSVAASRADVVTRLLTPLPGSVLDPLAEEVSFAAMRLAGADPQAIVSHGDLVACVRSFTAILETGWIPGRSVAFVDLHCSRGGSGGSALAASIGVGMCGSHGTTEVEARAFAQAARRLLSRHPGAYRIEPANSAELLDIHFAQAALIGQRTVAVTGAVQEAKVVSRFDREADSWLALTDALLERSSDTRLRVTMLASELGLEDQVALRDALEAARTIATEATDPELQHRAFRLETTVIDVLESYRSPLFVGEVALLSEAPLPDVFVRDVATAITNELDVIHLGEHGGTASPVVAARRRLVGGFTIERDPAHLADAVALGLPRAGVVTSRELADLFSLTEAACAFRWPVPAGRAIATVPSSAARTLPAPPALPVDGCLVGHDPNGVELRLGTLERTGHIHLLGSTGTGKSTLIEALIRDDLARSRPFVLLDPHGDLAVRVRHAARRASREIALLDPPDPRSTHLTLFEGIGPTGVMNDDLVERSISRIIDAMAGYQPADWIGPRFRSNARCLLTLLAYGRTGLELCEVSRIVTDPGFRSSVVSTFDGPPWVIPQLNSLVEPRSDDGTVNWFLGKFEDIARARPLRRLLAPVGGGITVATVLAQSLPLVCNLGKGEMGATPASLLGHLVLSQAIDAALGRPPDDRELFSIYVDEAHSFPVGNLRRGLAEARKFGAGLVLAHQHLTQLAPEARDAVLGNTAIRIAFRLTRDDAILLAGPLGVAPRDLSSQPNLHAYASYAVGGQPLSTFSLLLDPPAPLAAESDLELPERLYRSNEEADLGDLLDSSRLPLVALERALGPVDGDEDVCA